jgi:hypothetical protein
VYDLFKRLRNELRKQAIHPSLYVMWAWMQHLQFQLPLPRDIDLPLGMALKPWGPQKGVYEWELAVLVKQLLAEAPDTGSTDLRSWRSFSATLNTLKDLDNDISDRYGELYRSKIFVEMSRHAHHQFWWQRSYKLGPEVTRYLKIFSSPAVDAILQSHLGMSTRALYAIGLSFSGHFLGAYEFVAPIKIHLTSVTAQDVDRFLSLYARDMEAMRALCREAQSFDENFIYAFNPLLQYPLVSYAGGSRLIAPAPRLLLRRFTEGVYYDVIGKNKKRSIDWIASDTTGELFIECKTKRMRLDAKFALSDLTPLEGELDKLGYFAVQVYKTLTDALEGGYPHWR